MDNFGKVSIITPSYNCEKYVGQAIESVQNQTYINWELLITDDCSTDRSREVITKYAESDSRIKLFCLDVNSGAGVARNNSIEKAHGRFIAFLDSDDMWMPQKLEKQLKFMVDNQIALSCTSYLTIDEDNNVKGIVIPPKHNTFFQNKCDDKVGFSSCVYDTSLVSKRQMPTIRKRQDWGLILSLLKDCKEVRGIKEPLSYYRKGQQSLSKKKNALVRYNIECYQTVLGWSYLKALLFFLIFFLPAYFCKRIGLLYINR